MDSVNDSYVLNITGICRICLKKSSEMKSLFTKLEESQIIESNITQWIEVLCRIVNEQIITNGVYPSLLCATCMPLIHAAYQFKVQYDTSNRLLQRYLTALENNTTNIIDYKVDPDNNVRETSKQQIDKRESKVYIKVRVPRQQYKKYNSKLCKSETVNPNTSLLNSHPCPICTTEFSALELRKHIQTHKAFKKYLSIPNEFKVEPSVKFYKAVDPTQNSADVSNAQVKLHKCWECENYFTATDLRIHIQTHRNQTEYKCKHCPRVFKKINHLKTHNVQHLKEHPFNCHHCGKGFVIQKNYECHMLTHNTNQVLPHECQYCLKRFSNPEHLNRHLVMHTENVSYSMKYKVCKCSRCLKTFKDKTELLYHDCIQFIKDVHDSYYPCKTCNKLFKNATGLYNHNRNIHKKNTAKVLCSVCGKYAVNIYNHMSQHSDDKVFECGVCEKRFRAKPQLRQHLLVHSGLKPFVCSVCGKSFNNLYNLQVHERIHKGDRCHICPLCSKGFLEKSYLKKHLLVHSKV